MGYMNVEVYHESADVTENLISYSRTTEICTSIGIVELIFVEDSQGFDVWDEIVIYEENIKKGTYLISEVVDGVTAGTITIRGQDYSKKLVDYFIETSYTIDYYSTTRSWIEQFLTEAGVTYEIRGGAGVPLSENTQLGLTTAYDAIMTLIQYSAWYMYFDANGKAIVGDMKASSANPVQVSDTTILKVETNKHDSMLRNRAVVWGNFDVDNNQQVFVDKTIHTPWNYDEADRRAVVFSNHNIRNNTEANNIANMILSEFAKINYEKSITIGGAVNVTVGEIAFINSIGHKGSGLVTTVDVQFSKDGLLTLLILDQRCPRLFTLWGGEEEEVVDAYVYIGTEVSGVWRKPFENSSWEDFSSGLVASGVKILDLHVNNDIFACVASGVTDSGVKSYYRDINSNWTEFIPSGLYDMVASGLYPEGVNAVACSINTMDNIVKYGYNTIPSGDNYRSWIVEMSPQGEQLRADQIYASGEDYNVQTIDFGTNDLENIVSIFIPSGITEVVTSGANGLNYGWNEVADESLEGFYFASDNAITIMPSPQAGEEVVENSDYMTRKYTATLASSTVPVGLPERWSDFGNIPVINTDDDNRYIYHINYYKPTGTWKLYRVRFYLVEGPPDYFAYETSDVTLTGFKKTFNGSYRSMFLYADVDNPDIAYVYTTYNDAGTLKIYQYEVDFDASSSSETLIKSVTGTFPDSWSPLYGGVLVGDTICIPYMLRTGSYTDTLHVINITASTGTVNDYTVCTSSYGGGDKDYHLTTGGGSYLRIYTPCKEDIIVGAVGYENHPTNATDVGVVIFGKDGGTFHQLYSDPPPFGNPSDDWRSTGIKDDVELYHVASSDSTSYHIVLAYWTLQNWTGGLTEGEFLDIFVLQNGTVIDHTSLDDGTFTGADTLSSFETDRPNNICPYYLNYTTPPGFLNYPDNTHIEIRDLSYPFATLTTIDLPSEDYDEFIEMTGAGDDITDGFYTGLKDALGSTQYWAHFSSDGEFLYRFDDNITLGSSYDKYYFNNGYFIQRYIGTVSTIYYVDYIYDIYPERFRYGDANYQILRQRLDECETILTVSGEYKVEISLPVPSVVYNIPSGDTYLPVYQTYTNSGGSFSEINTLYPVYDLRVTDILVPSGVTIASGILNESDFRYAFIASQDAIKGYPTSLSGTGITIATFSGDVSHLETTNKFKTPYIFASVGSGGGQTFKQRNQGASSFIDYSTNLPNSDVTIIRVDDIL